MDFYILIFLVLLALSYLAFVLYQRRGNSVWYPIKPTASEIEFLRHLAAKPPIVLNTEARATSPPSGSGLNVIELEKKINQLLVLSLATDKKIDKIEGTLEHLENIKGTLDHLENISGRSRKKGWLDPLIG